MFKSNKNLNTENQADTKVGPDQLRLNKKIKSDSDQLGS